MILAADIGGTKALFGCFDIRGGRLSPELLREYRSRDFDSAEAAALKFLSEYAHIAGERPIEAACFALAGSVTGGECCLVNLGWRVGAISLRKALPGISHILMCNDLEATGCGLELLTEKEIISLNPNAGAGSPLKTGEGRRAIIAPGTGLGEAFILDGRVLASEGAHCEFGPRSELQARLWLYLHKKYGHVSYERILSGEGLVALERFAALEEGVSEERALTPADISRLAQSGECPLCSRALDIFVEVLGAEAGNLALKFLTGDGVYLAGGIAPKILPSLRSDIFMRSFCDKGRFSDFMRKIPVYAVLNPCTALYGAALYAARALDPGAGFALSDAVSWH